MAQIPKGRLVKGPYKPICRDCAIYFSITVNVGKDAASHGSSSVGFFLVIVYGFYHGKSPFFHHHVGNIVFFSGVDLVVLNHFMDLFFQNMRPHLFGFQVEKHKCCSFSCIIWGVSCVCVFCLFFFARGKCLDVELLGDISRSKI